MTNNEVRTRYAPSPTGFMHVGNLRTALYEYLVAKSLGGDFVLRIEDTDQERFVPGAVDVIYNTLKAVGLKHDEGPDIGGNYGPYIQSERLHMNKIDAENVIKNIKLDHELNLNAQKDEINIYKYMAEELVKKDKAYYCFCTKERLDALHNEQNSNNNFAGGYDRHCRNLTKKEIDDLLKSKTPYVIRQKVPLSGSTTFVDTVYGSITVENSEIEDQILLKTDSFPTYNFANVIDDYAMKITHVVRGCEYLSSTPKYNLLYDAFGWEKPIYIHLPLINGKNLDGTVSKLSKRHGSTGFDDLVKEGYLPEAIINYIALLGWCPKENREKFTLDELVKAFSIDRISKSPAIFDYDKLNWFNAEYIRAMSLEKFEEISMPYFKSVIKSEFNWSILASILHQRVVKLSQIPEMIEFFAKLPDYSIDLFVNKKSKSTLDTAPLMLKSAIENLEQLNVWKHDEIHDCLVNLALKLGVKNGTLMWPVRIAASGALVTPGGAIEILELLGKEESLRRLNIGISKLV